MKRVLLILFFIIVIAPLSLSAQQRQTEEIKSQADVYDEDMASSIQPKAFPVNHIQFGGWITPVYFYQWDKEQKLAVNSIDTRLWLKAYIINDIFVYARAKDLYTGILKDKGYGDLDKHDNLIELDMAYAGYSTRSRNLNVSAGRKFYTLGTGLVLNGRGDGAQVNYYSAPVNFTFLAMYTGLLAEESNPYGLSSKDFSDGARRAFTGAMFFRTILNQTVYAFGLAQFDRQKDAKDDKTKYDSQYWGAGAKGFIGNSLSYYGEFIYETGQAYNISGDKCSVSAFAVNSEINYYFNMKMNPTAIFQYAMGSGDKDRGGIAPDGNKSDKDTGFIYFGTYSGGYALRPYLMNIHILRGGFSIAPMSESDKMYLNRMYVIFKYSMYLKHKKGNTLADGGAGEEKIFAGHGLDAALKWIIYSDLSVFLNGAVFIPGSAYESGTDYKRYFIFTGLNLAF